MLMFFNLSWRRFYRICSFVLLCYKLDYCDDNTSESEYIGRTDHGSMASAGYQAIVALRERS